MARREKPAVCTARSFWRQSIACGKDAPKDSTFVSRLCKILPTGRGFDTSCARTGRDVRCDFGLDRSTKSAVSSTQDSEDVEPREIPQGSADGLLFARRLAYQGHPDRGFRHINDNFWPLVERLNNNATRRQYGKEWTQRLNCPSCAAAIEKEVRGLSGVAAARSKPDGRDADGRVGQRLFGRSKMRSGK